jgi:uncharacterized protein
MEPVSVFHTMVKPTGALCNLNCDYCFYLEKEHQFPKNNPFVMSDEVMEQFIRGTILGHSTPTVAFAWQGGEPTLLGIDFFRKVVAYQEKYRRNMRIENGFQTNGVLLNDEWCEFLRENDFLVGLSIDGPEELHDLYRKTKGGGPSFHKVMDALECLKRNRVKFNTLTVVHQENADHPQEIYKFLKDIGSQFMQFIPIVERQALEPVSKGETLVTPAHQLTTELTAWSVRPEQWGEFLCSIYDTWIQRDVGKIYVQLFDVMLEAWSGFAPSLCIFRENCGTNVVLESNGDLYSCDHYVYPQFRQGNILEKPIGELVSSNTQQLFGLKKRIELTKTCIKCPYCFACNGDCPKHRFVELPDERYKQSYLCQGYLKFFEHIDETMSYMADELRKGRAPANVMSRYQI